MLSTDSASSDISSLIFNGLLKYDKDLNIVGDLAERWGEKHHILFEKECFVARRCRIYSS